MVQIIQTLELLFKTVSTSGQKVALKKRKSKKINSRTKRVGISKDDNKIYVTNTQEGTISIINLITKTAKVIETGGKPELMHHNHDHSLLYIARPVKRCYL